MVYGAQTAQVIYVAAKLGIADLLKERPKDVEEIAAAAGVGAAVLRRILNFLVSRGLLGEVGDGRFASTRCTSVRSSTQRSCFLFGASCSTA